MSYLIYGLCVLIALLVGIMFWRLVCQRQSATMRSVPPVEIPSVSDPVAPGESRKRVGESPSGLDGRVIPDTCRGDL